jgi:hypothetical protein
VLARERSERAGSQVYSFRVANIAITAPGNTVAGYVPNDNTGGASFWNDAGSAEFVLQTATANATIRYGFSPDAGGLDLDCKAPCTPASATCTECTPEDAGCPTGSVPASTTIEAIGCKTGYSSSPVRIVRYAPP